MSGDRTNGTLGGRYELGRRLGSGGMSTVVLAEDRRLERPVAIKLLAEHLADDTQFVSRFRREALAVAKLIHPNIVQVYDFGQDEQLTLDMMSRFAEEVMPHFRTARKAA